MGREDGRNNTEKAGRKERGRENKARENRGEQKGRRASWARGRREGRKEGRREVTHREGPEDEESRSEGERQTGRGRSGQERALVQGETERKHSRPPNIKYLTGDDKSNGNHCGKNIIRNLIEVKQNLHNTAN